MPRLVIMQVKSEPKINFFPLSHDEACEVPKSKLPFSSSLCGDEGRSRRKDHEEKRGKNETHVIKKKGLDDIIAHNF